MIQRDRMGLYEKRGTPPKPVRIAALLSSDKSHCDPELVEWLRTLPAAELKTAFA